MTYDVERNNDEAVNNDRAVVLATYADKLKELTENKNQEEK